MDLRSREPAALSEIFNTISDDNNIETVPSTDLQEPIIHHASKGDSVIGSNAMTPNHNLDSSVSFEEYSHWAGLTRQDEKNRPIVHSFTVFGRTVRKQQPQASEEPSSGRSVTDKKLPIVALKELPKASIAPADEINQGDNPKHLKILDQDYATASRALRTASWGAVFYLLMMDILGPFSVPWAFAALGYGPGVTIYTVLFLLATYNGFLLWKIFLGVDSHKYPVKTYADIAFRIYGTAARHVVTFLQSTQLMFNVGIIILINTLSLDQIITGSGRNTVCFVALCLVWALAGMVFGQIQTLRRLAWVANFAIWLNLFSIIAIMGVVASSGVLQNAAARANASFNILAGEPINTTAGGRAGLDFTVSVTGAMSAVYSFGGAILFVEFLGEMSRPMDFWKALICTEILIYVMYLTFGLFVYSFQGQYTFNPTYQGLSPYAWRTAISSIQLITSCVATLLYANIGLKVVYNNVLISLFNVPHLNTKTGKVLWAILVPFYWGLAFLVATAIPQVSNLSGLIAAICVLQFSFTFPPALFVGFNIRRDSMIDADGWDPLTGIVTRQDGGWTRLWRGYKKKALWNVINTLLFFMSASLCLLGIYSAVDQIRNFYSRGASTAFNCRSPYSS